MNRKALPLCSLALIASLASCSPVVQTVGGAYQTNVVAGIPLALATKIPASQITDQTPNDVYATFADCQKVAVSVADVRRLGVEAADGVCRDTEKNLNAAKSSLGVVGVIALIPILYFLYLLFSTLLSAVGSV
ncbi:hypothetical protein [Deinococcus sp. UYEF24]